VFKIEKEKKKKKKLVYMQKKKNPLSTFPRLKTHKTPWINPKPLCKLIDTFQLSQAKPALERRQRFISLVSVEK
jgi:hypothetical protein